LCGGSGYHLRVGAEAALDDEFGLDAKVCGLPKHEIGDFTYFDTSDQMSHALRYGRVDGVFANVPLYSEVVGVSAFVFFERATLDFVLVGRVPGAQDDLAASAHGLRIRRHHGYGAEVV
jgi:hypothetical protein